ncbi:helix-turn-helix transcriptional regulator [Agromyces mangrovi Wang et al. 2018]|uniref:helix-turn-helix transcriptional regulator n=1 Tax=Agromyces mangrovi TaxID=1858653 RepID=UPI002572F987|nr:helix-turn-helix transcriptional regulator [Agromyces mangrovi]BDZ63476.1 helix-turn-helix transcriptional regulator [Agromyces mangrovi]
MPSELAWGRARSDVDVLSRAGLPLHQFMDEASEAVRRAIPFVGGCLVTLDPATAMVSSTRKVGDLEGRNDGDVEWAGIEYCEEDPTSLARMVHAGAVAVGVNEALGGELDRSVRMADFMVPRFDYVDEARAIFADKAGPWGAISMFRGTDDAPFSGDEMVLLAELAPAFTRGIRAGLLARMGRTDAGEDPGPAVMVIDAVGTLVQSSPGATAQLARMSEVPNTGDPLTIVHALVHGARAFARGESDRMPRIRVRTADGVWLVLHATPLGGAADRAGDVVVTIAEARPQEIIGLVADAFGLTAREREVVGMVLRGADTKEIAAAIHVSPYTVQDHLKSIFEKAGVTSRRELVARVYFDQYIPRMGAEISPTGWFAG